MSELNGEEERKLAMKREQNMPYTEATERKETIPDVVEGDKSNKYVKQAKVERQRKRQELAAASAALSAVSVDSTDPLAANYGDSSLIVMQSKPWTGMKFEDLDNKLEGQLVYIRGRVQTIRAVGKKTTFVVLRKEGFTVQCVLAVMPDVVSPQMLKFARGLSKESIVDIEGIVSVPEHPIIKATQQVEIQVRRLYCHSRASLLPMNIEDVSRSEAEIEKAEQAGEKFVRVNQDTRLNNRVLDIRTSANHAIFRVEWMVEKIFQDVLHSKGFVGIHTPQILAGSSEGGSAVFRLNYYGQPACLAQSPQLHKQMAICGDFGRVFEISHVFRAEDSFTHRHLCEFVGLDVEMEINWDYSEIMDLVGELFVEVFDEINKTCQKDLETICRQYPFEPLKYTRPTRKLTFEDGIEMLKKAGVEVDPLGDLNTEAEKKLGQLVLEKYGTEFYILHEYPLSVRPFYTMPCPGKPDYSNSFDAFLRGEEIISGAQRIHIPELLEQRAKQCGIDVSTISTYIDSFRYGTPFHGGFGVGLERVVMLFCALNNIRKTSLFPRDPHRLAP